MITRAPETQTSGNDGGEIPPLATTDEWGGFPDHELYPYRLAKGTGYGILRLSGLDYSNFLLSSDTASAVRGPDDDEIHPLIDEVEDEGVIRFMASRDRQS